VVKIIDNVSYQAKEARKTQVFSHATFVGGTRFDYRAKNQQYSPTAYECLQRFRDGRPNNVCNYFIFTVLASLRSWRPFPTTGTSGRSESWNKI